MCTIMTLTSNVYYLLPVYLSSRIPCMQAVSHGALPANNDILLQFPYTIKT